MFAFGVGIGTRSSRGNWLEVFYPAPLHTPDAALGIALAQSCAYRGGNEALQPDAGALRDLGRRMRAIGFEAQAALIERLAGTDRPQLLTCLATDAPPRGVAEAYLKLHLLSHRLCRPRQQNLEGLFAVLPNVAWTSEGAIEVVELDERRLQARLAGRILIVDGIDKFPRMTDYVVPAGVRIADASRVRLGAYLGEGTTVMHEGFVNFNAGTEGPCMIEGRISAGVFVGAGSDLGGGCSTMGTLSGGNSSVIAVGRECLVGANAGIGISLGDRCTVEAGLYVTAGSRITVRDEMGAVVKTVAARELSGGSDMLFRRNSLNGAIECLSNRSAIALNESLHSHN
ncbi:MAG: 2,3,4,5-tetrahydropyridine-2,6-dicarboxylate N-succinyltransferase [Gammaproteobacteria bacterium]|nr:2,3,4,5-tetrahydropyridine-2,6-dicarboxylate N-succinyltransferase [Gammaproteobacteria bacterium]